LWRLAAPIPAVSRISATSSSVRVPSPASALPRTTAESCGVRSPRYEYRPATCPPYICARRSSTLGPSSVIGPCTISPNSRLLIGFFLHLEFAPDQAGCFGAAHRDAGSRLECITGCSQVVLELDQVVLGF